MRQSFYVSFPEFKVVRQFTIFTQSCQVSRLSRPVRSHRSGCFRGFREARFWFLTSWLSSHVKLCICQARPERGRKSQTASRISAPPAIWPGPSVSPRTRKASRAANTGSRVAIRLATLTGTVRTPAA